MADRFLREVSNMHQLRKDIRSLPLAKTEGFMKRLGDDAADDWVFRARDAQLPPPDLDWCWLFLGGRGAGKSHSMSAAVHMAVRAGTSRIHLIAPTTADFHDVNLEGRSGILATCGRDPRPCFASRSRSSIARRSVSLLPSMLQWNSGPGTKRLATPHRASALGLSHSNRRQKSMSSPTPGSSKTCSNVNSLCTSLK